MLPMLLGMYTEIERDPQVNKKRAHLQYVLHFLVFRFEYHSIQLFQFYFISFAALLALFATIFALFHNKYFFSV